MTPVPPRRPLRLGTRRSLLARTQAQGVADALTAATGRPVELVEVTTHGDTSGAALTQIGGTGVFVAALRARLLEGDIDLAVHSLKDLPTDGPQALCLAAVPQREDPRDVLVARDRLTLAQLPPGSRIGTGAPRRAAQLLALGAGHVVEAVRGNVDTRLALVAQGRLDAVLLARAGLARLGRLEAASEVLDPMLMLPAPGQGALAVECRVRDYELRELLAVLDHPDSRAAVSAERALLAALEAGCTAPVGALAEVVEAVGGELEISLRALVAAPDGAVVLRQSLVGPADDPDALGRSLAARLLQEGAAALAHRPTRQPESAPVAPYTSPDRFPSTDPHLPERAS